MCQNRGSSMAGWFPLPPSRTHMLIASPNKAVSWEQGVQARWSWAPWAPDLDASLAPSPPAMIRTNQNQSEHITPVDKKRGVQLGEMWLESLLEGPKATPY